MKLSTALVLGLSASTASAFAPAQSAFRPAVVTAQPAAASALFMSDEAAVEAAAAAYSASEKRGVNSIRNQFILNKLKVAFVKINGKSILFLVGWFLRLLHRPCTQKYYDIGNDVTTKI